MKKFQFAAVILCLVTFLGYAITIEQYDKLGLAVGTEAPNIKMKNLAGEDFELKQLRGKVVLVDFWATWCGDCVKEMPSMKEVYKKYHDKGFEIVGFSVDEERQELVDYVKKNEIEWTVVNSQAERFIEIYKTRGLLPYMFLLDHNGVIVAKGSTLLNVMEEGNLEKAVAKYIEKLPKEDVKEDA